MRKCNLLALLSIVAMLTGCGNSSSSVSSSVLSSSSISSSEITSISSVVSSSEIENKALKFFQNKEYGQAKEMPGSLPTYIPSLFDKTTFTTSSPSSLGSGVNYIKYSFNLTNGNKVEMHTIHVDTTKASIRSSSAATIATVGSQIEDFESANPDVKVMAGVNADFFATGSGGSSVNAYVKDNFIKKAGHNDTGYYDYTDSRSDVPASNPMLLGVSGSHVKIGAIVNGKTKKETVQSTFTYKVFASEGVETPSKLEGEMLLNKARLNDSEFNLVNNGIKFYSEEGEKAIKIKPIVDESSSFTYGEVISVKELQGEAFATSTDYNKGYIYIFASADTEHTFKAGDYVGYTLNSQEEDWLGYSTIIGGRQSLVENGKIASTVTLENTNGAQKSDIPRTCAGIKTDGTLVIAVCEALRYGGKSSSTSDPYGVNLPELAQFMRYIGCYDALNFDGGGSTQLITSKNNGTATKTSMIRSSDYGTKGVSYNRKVYNTLLVTTK